MIKTDELLISKAPKRHESLSNMSLRLSSNKRNVQILEQPDVIMIDKDMYDKDAQGRSRGKITYEVDQKSSSRGEHSSQGTSSKSRSSSTFEINNKNFIIKVQSSIKNLKICTGFGVIYI
jgi:hypothetical protein